MTDATYRLPRSLSPFQEQMYKHLIDWKREHITEESGAYAGKAYDALLPESCKGELPHLYEPVRQRFLDHQRSFPFDLHKFADHMASSQIACANLFLPLLAHPEAAAAVLSSINPDLVSIATDHLDAGFRIEFWDEPDNMLGDHTKRTGTDADIAIAYRDKEGELCLWLIEHKLTEAEFTTCGGAKSPRKIDGKHSCDDAAEILKSPDLCYYRSGRQYNYWDITLGHASVFPRENFLQHGSCPFREGTNQLWRNMLLALAIEDSPAWPYKRAHFSVCHHPDNTALQASMDAFAELLGDGDRFSSFTSNTLVDAAQTNRDRALNDWVAWYRDLYFY